MDKQKSPAQKIKEPRGTPIEGSKLRLYRDYCADCQTPLRVSREKLFTTESIEAGRKFVIDPSKENYCEKCDPHPVRYQRLAPHQELVRRRQSDKDI